MPSINETMQQRLCMPISVFGTAEHIISVLLSENMLFPRDGKRKTPFVGLRVCASTEEEMHFSLEQPRMLSEVVDELCERSGLRIAEDGCGVVAICA